MKVFLKFVLKSMTEKKGKFLLLLLAVFLSTALFVGSYGMTGLITDIVTKEVTETSEGRDIVITEKNGESFFSIDKLKENGIKDINPYITVTGSYSYKDDMSSVSIEGRKNVNINKNQFIKGEKSLDNFDGEKCIISKRISEKLKIGENDKLEISVNGEKIGFTVYAVYSNEGTLSQDQENNFTIIVPYKFISEKFDLKNKYNNVFATGTKETLKDSIKAFNSANKDFKAEKAFDENIIDSMLSQIITIFYVMLSIVVLVSVVIISSSFKLIVTERMPTIGTFLSQGATKKKVISILFLESFTYGLFGGILGLFGGYGILYLVSYASSPFASEGIINTPNFKVSYIVVALAFGIGLSVISSLLPVLKVRKLPIKDVILGALNNTFKVSWTKAIIGTILLLIGTILQFKENINISMAGDLLILLGSAFIIPKIIDLISTAVHKIIRDKTSIIAIAFNNVRTSKELLNSITLIIISVLSVIIITSASSSLKDVVSGAYEDMIYDISISFSRNPILDSKDKIINEVLNRDDIDKNSIQSINFTYGEIDKEMITVMGIDEDKYLNYDKYLSWDSNEGKESYEALKKAKKPSVILTKSVSESLNLDKGDTIKLKIGDKNCEVKIVSVIDGKLYCSGYFIMMKNKDLIDSFNPYMNTEILANTKGDADKVKDAIKKPLRDYLAEVSTSEELKQQNIENNEQMMKVFSFFSFITVVIAAFGVLNNMNICYLNSKKNLALLHSLGLSKRQKNRLLLYQGLLTIFWSMVFMVPLAYVTINLVTNVIKAIGFDMTVALDLTIIPKLTLGLVILIVLSILPSIFKGRKFSIINEMKYE